MNARHFVKMLSVVLLLSPAVFAQTLDRRQFLPDLVPLDVNLGDGCRIIVTLRNNGPGIVPPAGYSLSPPGSSGVQMYNDGAPWGGIVLGGLDPSHLTQPVGGTVSYAWFPGLALPPGTHVVKVDVDNNNAIAESNELNNSLIKRLTCQPQLPDLQPIDLNLDADCKIDVTIRNNGPAIVPDAGYSLTPPGSSGVQMYSDGTPWGGIVLGFLDPSHVSQPVGGTVTYKFSSLPIPPGIHLVKLDVDNNNTIVESNEANNSLSKTLNCQTPLPDLQPISFSLQQTGIRPNSPCQIIVTYRNNGPGIVPDAAFVQTAQGPGVQMYNDGAPWGGIILGGIDPTKILQPAGATLTKPWFVGTPNLFVSAGQHVLRIDVDNTNIVAESNEANNSLTQTVTCGIVIAPPTLQP
jgi:hypothetical protein